MKQFIKEIIKKNKIIYKILIKLQKKRDSYYLHKYGLEALDRIDKVLKKLEIEYWLDTSTLLGAIREKGFIKGDNDLGIGIDIKKYIDVIKNEFEKNNIILIREYLIDNGSYGREQTYLYKGVEIDIFYHTIDSKNNKTKYHSFIPFDNNLKDKYQVKEATFPFEGLIDYIFLEKIFKIPKNYIEYTRIKYGDNFMQPNPNWTMNDEKNTVILKDKYGILKIYNK